MGKVRYHVTMSLDGFIAGANDAMDWVFGYVDLPSVTAPGAADSSSMAKILEETIRCTGSVLSGKRSYNVGRKPGQRPEARKVLGGAWNGPVFVLTHKPPEDEEDPTITFVSGNIRSVVGRALEAAKDKNVLLIGADVARQCIQEGLVDEILIHLAPVLLGDGVRIFHSPGLTDGIRLEPTEVSRAGQLTNLAFRVLKPH
jgi:dihydrofolate reductase